MENEILAQKTQTASLLPAVACSSLGDGRWLPAAPSDPPNPKFRIWLENRRITLQTVAVFQICPDSDQHGMSYPVPNGGNHLRWKNFDSTSPQKYRWMPDRPDNQHFYPYYHAPNLENAVQNTGGACWLVSGEADVWSMWTAGIEHVLSCGYTENHVPENLPVILKKFGVNLLYIAPDLDPTGQRWAQSIIDCLADSGIVVDIRRLPEGLEEKGDLGKAWVKYGRPGFAFERWLLGLSNYNLQPTPKTGLDELEDSDSWISIPAGYRILVAQALGVSAFGMDQFSERNVRCPFHDDATPSASLHKEKGLYCHVEGKMYRWTEVGVKIGVESLAHYFKNHLPIFEDMQDQLTTEIRQWMICNKVTSTARLLDSAYRAGIKPGSEVTIQDLVSVCHLYNFSELFVWRAVNPKVTITGEDGDLSFQILPLFSLQHKERGKDEKKSGRGQSKKLYRIPFPAEIEAKLFDHVRTRYFDPITNQALHSTPLYHAEVYAAPVMRKPGNYSRLELSEPLDISFHTARRYDVLAHLVVTPRYQEEWMTAEDLAKLPDKWEKFYKILRTTSGKEYPPTLEGGQRALMTGEMIILFTRLTNHYAPENEIA
jgi:hypothetical protein